MSELLDAGSPERDPAHPLLEVITLTVEDAVAAARGGADRLELVREIGTGGLTPNRETFERIRAAVDVPLRVMLRTNAGFEITPDELDALCEDAAGLRAAGANQFVLGFLDANGDIDLSAIERLIRVIEPCPWTLHHAFDHARDDRGAWESVRSLPGLDTILSGGVRGDLGQGLDALIGRASWQSEGPRWLAGGRLKLDFVGPLRAAGISQLHTGRAARSGARWDCSVSVAAVRRWRMILDGAA